MLTVLPPNRNWIGPVNDLRCCFFFVSCWGRYGRRYPLVRYFFVCVFFLFSSMGDSLFFLILPLFIYSFSLCPPSSWQVKERSKGGRERHSQINTGREMAITTPIYKAKYLGASWWSPTCKCPRVDTYCWWDFPRDEVVARRTETLPTFLLVVSRLARGRRRPYRALFERRFWDGVNKAGGVTVMMA